VPPGLPAAPSQVAAEPLTVTGNFPNPFNPETWIAFALGNAAEVTVRIYLYSLSGELVRSIELGHLEPGAYSSRDTAAYWDGRNATGEAAASGVYAYEVTAGDASLTRRMLLSK